MAAVGCSAHVRLAPHRPLRANCSALAGAAGRVYQDHVAHLELVSFSGEGEESRRVYEKHGKPATERWLTEEQAILFY